ncbi:hypothetical protein SASPL_119008 [Salvia splendens]|uniref:BAG domain-containing protein n=1 Tax=Salvia splendens TaxID=180675 RepID=A0A8X8XXS7_SALSN|nr:uncharacterized protein LOC121806346 [Salvia splendens]KAG6422436.1 hypothetical protein SASPL_119008 [Salvia splendens]
MYSPFFTNHRRYQQPHPTYHPFHPVYYADPVPEDLRPAEMSAAPKVVRIPVQFAGSERLDRTEWAVKIQKVFRGYLARKSLRKVKDIKLEVDEIEERLRSCKTVELVKTDAKERLRMSESLMCLLLKLDSICGVDLGVKGCRKSVIRKAIGLQERIDAIVAGEIEAGECDCDVAENCADLKDSCEIECDAGVNEAGESECGVAENRVDLEESCEMERGREDEGGMGDCEVKASGETERELLEKTVKENEKMVRMMSELFERNEAQTRMLNALTQRVGMLERMIVCDRMRKKKKKAAPLPCTDK